MADLQVVAVLVAKPGSEDIVKGALADLVAPTRAEEGNVSYDLYESASTPGTFVTVEVWHGQADLDAHMQTPHIARTFEVAGEHLGAAPAIHPLLPVSS
jgi:quinol monooxygenase YgiN